MAKPKWRTYEVVSRGSQHADAFLEGAQRNGNVQDRCPLCDGRRLHRRRSFMHCREHASWMCGEAYLVGCHDCKVRWGVIVSKCSDAAEKSA